MILPPGSILQKMHFIEQIKNRVPGYFMEIGPGCGTFSQVLLNHKWRGEAFELDKTTACNLKEEKKNFLDQNHFKIKNIDFLKYKTIKKADLILASLVIEHFSLKKEEQFFRKSRFSLKKNGSLLCYIPGSPDHWGIEDETAGHHRRYTIGGLRKRLASLGWKPKKIEGITYPLSNVLLPISNWLVKKYEAEKLKLNFDQRTRSTGRRCVPFKTKFPSYLKIILNPFILYPFYLMQVLFKNHPKSLTLFFEATPVR